MPIVCFSLPIDIYSVYTKKKPAKIIKVVTNRDVAKSAQQCLLICQNLEGGIINVIRSGTVFQSILIYHYSLKPLGCFLCDYFCTSGERPRTQMKAWDLFCLRNMS